MTVAVVISIVIGLAIAGAVAFVRRLPATEEHVPSGPPTFEPLPEPVELPVEDDATEDTEDVAEELTEADSLVGDEDIDWPARFEEAAAEAGCLRDPRPLLVLRDRFLAIEPCPDEDLASIVEREPADFLRQLAHELESTDPRRALALVTAATLLEDGRGDLRASAARIALASLNPERAREEARRAAAIDPGAAGLVDVVERLFSPAPDAIEPSSSEVPGSLPPRAPLLRSAAEVREVLALYHGRLLARRRTLVAAGAPGVAAWLPTPPDAWRGDAGPEILEQDRLVTLRSLRAEWAGALALCAAVGWDGLEPSASIRRLDRFELWLAWVRHVHRFVREPSRRGRPGAQVMWDGLDLGQTAPELVDLLAAEIGEVRAALEWLVRDDLATPFADALRDLRST